MCYPTSKQLPRRPSHRHPSDVPSPTKNPIVIVAIKKSSSKTVIMNGMMKAGTAHATDTTLLEVSESVEFSLKIIETKYRTVH